ncbi:hypothetical protein ACFYUY_37490 [Kitasatospora sp. NPDC004745]|uniref:hypothetical protein n=1 Tax=unclassified Kitasatospora TaxID=2633591 RepID=UPI0033C31468
MAKEGLRVTVQGDLPHDVLERIGNAVRKAVLYEVAELDLVPPLREVPLAGGARDAVDAVIHRPGPIGIQMAPEQ